MVVAQRAAAQNEAQFSDYTRLKSFYNPAVRKRFMWGLICQFISSIPTMERE